MRRRAVFFLAGALALAACAPRPMPSTAELPPGAFGGNADNGIMAINLAAWAFADPARTHGNPIDATRAVLAIEYLAGQLSSSPRWDYMSQLTKLEMLQARQQVRATLGIAEDAPSQAVANSLLALSTNPTPAVANQVLRAPVFTLPPTETLARINNLPYLPLVNQASQGASAQEFPSSGPNCIMCG
jgi:hypothetical protein